MTSSPIARATTGSWWSRTHQPLSRGRGSAGACVGFRCEGRRPQRRDQPHRGAGPELARDPAGDGRSRGAGARRAEVLLAPRRQPSRVCHCTSAAPATRARTATSCTSGRRAPTSLWRALRRRGRGPRVGARRAREPRHPAARGGHAALRPRARARDVPGAGGSRPRRGTGQGGRLRRPRCRRGRASPRVLACSSASPPRASARAAPTTRCSWATQAVGVITSGALSPTLGHPIAMAYVDADVAERRHRTRDRRPRFANTRIRRPPSVLQERSEPWLTRARSSTPPSTNGWTSPGTVATVGITAYAAEKLGDVVYVDLPAVGATVAAGRVVGEIESTKSVGRAVRADQRDRGRAQRGRRRVSGTGEQRPVRRGLAHQGGVHRAARAPHPRAVHRAGGVTGE